MLHITLHGMAHNYTSIIMATLCIALAAVVAQAYASKANLHLKLGDFRSASRTPTTFTRGPTPPNSTNNNTISNRSRQAGLMNRHADLRPAATAAPASYTCTRQTGTPSTKRETGRAR